MSAPEEQNIDRKIERVTSVLPCADAPLTLANLAEYILTDIWVRFRMHDGRPVLRGYIDDALEASRSPSRDSAHREIAAREAAQRPRVLKLFQLEGDSVSAGSDYTAGASVRSPGALHLFSGAKGAVPGPGLTAETYLRYLDPAALRYNLAAEFLGGPADLRIPTESFQERYNSDVVELFAGIFADLDAPDISSESKDNETDHGTGAGTDQTRVHMDGDEEALRGELADLLARSRTAYDAWDFAGAVNLAVTGASRIRNYMDENGARIHETSSRRGAALGAARVLATILAPVLPVFSAGVAEFLTMKAPFSFQDTGAAPPPGVDCCHYRSLAAAVEERDMSDMFAAAQTLSTAVDSASTVEETPAMGLISPDVLGRVDLRAGRVVSAEVVEGADKLLRLELDLGEEQTRHVLAGLREAYEPGELAGLTIACVANLPPRETRFGVSRAMILAAGNPPVVFTAHGRTKPGERLR